MTEDLRQITLMETARESDVIGQKTNSRIIGTMIAAQIGSCLSVIKKITTGLNWSKGFLNSSSLQSGGQ